MIKKAAADAGWIYLPGQRVMVAKAHVTAVRKVASGVAIFTTGGSRFPVQSTSLASFFDTYWGAPLGLLRNRTPTLPQRSQQRMRPSRSQADNHRATGGP